MIDNQKYARFNKEDGKKQTLKNHLEGVTRRMGEYAIEEFSNILKLIGILHDFGKGSRRWQEYLFCGNMKEKCPHSPQGAMYIDELHDNLKKEIIDEKQQVLNDLASDLLRYVILAHHGIFDAMQPDGEFSLDNRAKLNQEKGKYLNDFIECKEENKKEFPDIKFLDTYKRAVAELEKKLWNKNDQIEYDIGFFARMFLSMLIDADWSDASYFSDANSKYEERVENFIWDKFLERIEKVSEGFECKNELDRLRGKISEECKISAEREPGIYRLNVPTGGGKTISAMRFALNHAKKYRKKHIIYVAPFISILEQNANKYREILAQTEEDKEYIISHYTDLTTIKNDKSIDVLNVKYDSNCANIGIDNWSSPIIFTTMVQMLLTLFSSNKYSIRRTHNLADSVIIIDEYQALPIKCVSMFNRAINALSKHFGSTIVICTATQPPLDDKKDTQIKSNTKQTKVQKIVYKDSPDLVGNYDNEIVFKRVDMIDARKNKGKGDCGYSVEEFKNFVLEKANSIQSILVILNTRRAVKELFVKLQENKESELLIYMLSNDMCPAHRNEILENIKERLKEKKKVVLVSTSLIEAGVDISFAGVIRSLSGLDIIVQAAGRCNRNAEEKVGKGWIVELSKDLENVKQLSELQKAQDKMRCLLNDFSKNPQKYENSIMSKEMLETYFSQYYQEMADQMSYPVDGTYMVEFLGENQNAVYNCEYKKNQLKNVKDIRLRVKQSFATAGKKFSPIETDARTVLVPYKEGKKIIANLCSSEFKKSPINYRRALLKQAEYFSVNVFQNVFVELENSGGLGTIDIGDDEHIIYFVKELFYGDNGLNYGNKNGVHEGINGINDQSKNIF